jgi:hypothetical protein
MLVTVGGSSRAIKRVMIDGKNLRALINGREVMRNLVPHRNVKRVRSTEGKILVKQAVALTHLQFQRRGK